MTQQQPDRPPGVWDSVFHLVFGRRGPARRPTAPSPAPPQARTQPAPAPIPQPAPPPPPAPEVRAEPAPPPPEIHAEPAPPLAGAPEPVAEPPPVVIDAAPPAEAAPPPVASEDASMVPEDGPPIQAPTVDAAPLDSESSVALDDIVQTRMSSDLVADPRWPPFVQALVRHCEDEWEAFRRGEIVETSTEGSALVAKYWQALDPRSNDEYEQRTGRTPIAWSAAFVSYVMRQAGAGNRFRYHQGHWAYIIPAIHAKDDPNASFQGLRPEDYAPQVGDIIGNVRAANDDWRRQYPDGVLTYDTATSFGWFLSHCDVVVEKSDTHIHIIGGNVSNSASRGAGVTVNRKSLEIGPDGRLKPSEIRSKKIFVILKNNLVDPV